MRLPCTRAVLVFASLSLATAIAACNQPPAADTPEAGTAVTPEDQIRRGEMLIIGGACHDCHTPKNMTAAGPEADMSRSLSGHPEAEVIAMPAPQDPKSPWTTHVNDHLTAWSGAWGVSFAANLTPDENTGIGIWTEDMFLSAMKEGKHMGTSRPILPPMPWIYYGLLPEEDLRAMFAYLRSIPAIQNRVPVPLDTEGKPIEAP
jgi:mono/diheme cytochrome c family protein